MTATRSTPGEAAASVHTVAAALLGSNPWLKGLSTCAPCLARHSAAKVREGQVSRAALRCPHPGCKRALSKSELARLLDAAMYKKYERFLQSRKPNARWCAVEGCGKATLVAKRDDAALRRRAPGGAGDGLRGA